MNIQTQLVQARDSGGLLPCIVKLAKEQRRDPSELVAALTGLHNDGHTDIVATFRPLGEVCKRHEFFLVRRVFEKVLPEIDAPVRPVIDCVLKLHADAGEDHAAGTIVTAYTEFCSQDPGRPSAALAAIEKEPASFGKLLTATLVAGSKLDAEAFRAHAVRLCKNVDICLRREAVFSLGRIDMPLEPDFAAAEVVSALNDAFAEETEDGVLANIVTSAASVAVKVKEAFRRDLVTIVDNALQRGADITLHAASQALAFDHKEVPTAMVEVIINALQGVKASNAGTINMIDMAISNMLETVNCDKAIALAENILRAHQDIPLIDSLPTTAHAIVQDTALRNRIATRWLITGERALGSALDTILSGHHGPDIPLSVHLEELQPVTGIRIVFCARKAIGYLFMRPVSAASFLLSLLEHVEDEETQGELESLLFDPLMLNYSGSVREYLLGQMSEKGEPAKSSIQRAIDALERYIEDLRSVPELPALHPSQMQRAAHRRYYSAQMMKAYEQAEQQSVFLSLVPKSVILYGNKSIHYITSPDGDSHRQELPMASHGSEFEIPRQSVVDPDGLDMMLRIFKSEKLVQ